MENAHRLQVIDEAIRRLDSHEEPPPRLRQDTSDEEEYSSDEMDSEITLRIADRSSAAAQAHAQSRPSSQEETIERPSPAQLRMQAAIDHFNHSPQGSADITEAIGALREFLHSGMPMPLQESAQRAIDLLEGMRYGGGQ